METGTAFQIPSEGHLLIEFLDLQLPAPQETEEKAQQGVVHLIRNIKASGDQLQLLNMAKSGMHFKERDAQLILDSLLDGTDLLGAMVAILPHMVDPENALTLVEHNLNPAQRLRLQHLLFKCYGVIVGLSTGHYRLDLADPLDRSSMKMLIQLSNRAILYRRKHVLPDTSQHNNLQGFRNESLNGKAFVLDAKFGDQLPKFGVVEFDFVHLMRPPLGTTAMSTKRFHQLTAKLHLELLDPVAAMAVLPTARPKTPRVYDYLLAFQIKKQEFEYGDLYNITIEIALEGETLVFSARRLLFEFQALVCSHWISVKQLLRLLLMWPRAFAATRLEALFICFDRITDLYNFHMVRR
jgi:hypothetical protein